MEGAAVYRENDTNDPDYMSLYDIDYQGNKFMKNVKRIETRGSTDPRFKVPSIARQSDKERMMVLYPPYYAPPGEDYLPMINI